MRALSPWRSVLASVVGLALLAPACSGDGAVPLSAKGGAGGTPIVSFPSQLVGLTVKTENVAKTIEEVKRPYLDSLTVFSFREEKLLRATLQVSRFNRVARPNDSAFRGSIISQLGSSRPLELRVDDQTVYSTGSNKQNVFIWFTGRGLFVLSVTQDYVFPRTLLRRILEQRVEV